MKKSLIFVGLLAIGYANAQEGNVGINTDQPKATLDIQPNATNLAGTTNEGILAPRLSKTRIANIEASKLTEGTLVYATDDTTSPISAYTGTDTKVAKITEKGYYFYNGTEWVKAGVGANGELWAQRDNGGVTETYLKPADTNNDLVAYQSNRKYHLNLGQVDEQAISGTEGLDYIAKDIPYLRLLSSDVLPSTLSPGRDSGTFKFNYTANLLKGEHLQADRVYFGTQNRTLLRGTGSANNNSVFGVVNTAENWLTGSTLNKLVGQMVIAGTREQATTELVQGLVVEGRTFEGATVKNLVTIHAGNNTYGGKVENSTGIYLHNTSSTASSEGIYPTIEMRSLRGANFGALVRPNSKVTDVYAGTFYPIFYGESETTRGYGQSVRATIGENAKVGSYTGISNYIEARGAVETTDVYGFRFWHSLNKAFAPTNMYGLHIQDIDKATTNNFAIHTGKGQVRLGDLADTGATTDRVVTVDANGVLKTGGTIAANNGVQTQATMECNEDNRGKMNFGRISINSKETDAIGFCMKNGDNQFRWYYIYGGASHTVGTNANFGQGL